MKKVITGIYIIRSKIDGRVYVGRSKNIADRWQSHLRELRGNYHYNGKLQNFYNKYGEKSLIFEILIECEEHQLKPLEVFYIKEFKSQKLGFNITDGTEGVENASQYKPGTKYKFQNALTGEIVEGRNLRNFAKQHNVNEACASALNRGVVKQMGEWYHPDLNPPPQVWTVISPTGESYNICEGYLIDFCEKWGLDSSSLFKVIKGVAGSHHGWRGCKPFVRKEMPARAKVKFKLKNMVTGVVEEGFGYSKFAKKYNLNISCVAQLINGENRYCKEWYNPAFWEPKRFTVVSPQGIEHEIIESKESEFYKKFNLTFGGMWMLLNGKIKTSQGWRMLNVNCAQSNVEKLCLV